MPDLYKYHLVPQDTSKVFPSSPAVSPFGRVEEFYDFTAPEPDPVSEEIKEKSTAKKAGGEKNVKEKTRDKKTPEAPTVKTADKAPAEKPASSQKDYKFLNDTVRKEVQLHYIQASGTGEENQTSTPLTGTSFLNEGSGHPAFFTGHLLQVKNPGPMNLPQRGEDNLLFAFIAILGLVSIVKLNYYKKAKQYISSFFNLRLNSQILREEKSVNQQLNFLMLLTGVLVTTTFIFQLFQHLGFKIYLFDNFLKDFVFLKIFLLVLGAILGKFLLVVISGFILNKGRMVSDYIVNQILYFNVLNILLLPLSILAQYSNFVSPGNIFITGGFLAVLIILFMVQRLFVLGNSESGTSSYYLFLYLCTLEILPMLIFAKLLMNAL